VAEIDRTSPVVCDSGPLIHLDELGSLDLLGDFATVVVPEPVWLEVERHRPAALLALPGAFERRGVEVAVDARFSALVRSLSLDAGEQAALSCAELQQGGVLLTDDSAARLAAKALGYRAHGTLGILLRALRRRQRSRSQVLSLLRSIPTSSTLHIRRELLEEVIDEVRRSPR
jgi:predicted nucleic acid-binding protein